MQVSATAFGQPLYVLFKSRVKDLMLVEHGMVNQWVWDDLSVTPGRGNAAAGMLNTDSRRMRLIYPVCDTESVLGSEGLSSELTVSCSPEFDWVKSCPVSAASAGSHRHIELAERGLLPSAGFIAILPTLSQSGTKHVSCMKYKDAKSVEPSVSSDCQPPYSGEDSSEGIEFRVESRTRT
jgi:hypothetical protein